MSADERTLREIIGKFRPQPTDAEKLIWNLVTCKMGLQQFKAAGLTPLAAHEVAERLSRLLSTLSQAQQLINDLRWNGFDPDAPQTLPLTKMSVEDLHFKKKRRPLTRPELVDELLESNLDWQVDMLETIKSSLQAEDLNCVQMPYRAFALECLHAAAEQCRVANVTVSASHNSQFSKIASWLLGVATPKNMIQAMMKEP